MSYPVDCNARQRLMAAQRAEATAVRDAESALRARDRVARRLAEADENLREARRSLVNTSGSRRAALLLGLEEVVLRRELRHTSETAVQD